MKKHVKGIAAVLAGVAMLFASCSSGGGDDGPSSQPAPDPVLTFSEVVQENDDGSYALAVTDVLPYATNSFTVEIANASVAPTVSVSSSDSTLVSAKATEPALDEQTKKYASVITYEVASFEDAEVSFVVTAKVGDKTISKTVAFTASIKVATETYKVTNLAQTLTATTNLPTSDHAVTLTWENPNSDLTKIAYKVTETKEGGTYASKVIALDSESATTLTTTESIPAESEFTVILYTVGSDGWSKTEVTGVKTANDATPPITPNVVAGSSTEETVTLVYTKGANADDTVKLVIDASEGAAIADTIEGSKNAIDVSAVAAGETKTITANVARAKESAEYTFTIVAYDAAGYAHTDTTGATAVEVKVSSVADTLAPAEVTNLVLDFTADTPTLTWENPADADFVKVNITAGESTISVNKDEQSFVNSVLQTSSITIKTVDSVGNESTGITFAVGTAPVLGENVTTGYTGQLVISGVSFDSDVTWTAEAANEGASAVIDSANGMVYVNGLTVGTEATPSVKFTAVKTNATINYAAVNAGKAVAPTMTVWKIRNWWPTDNPPYIVPHLAEGVTSANVVAAVNNSVSGTSQTSDMSYVDATYKSWIVWPSIVDNDDVEAVSLEATNAKGESSGLYAYADLAKSITWSNTYSNKTGWGYGNSSNPQIWVVAKDSMSAVQKSEAGFIVKASTTGYSDPTPAGYSGWFTVQSSKDTSYYWVGSCFNMSATTSPATNGDSDICYKAATWTGSEASAAPSAFTVSSSSTDHSITLTWTDPADADFSHITIATEDKQLDGTTAVLSETMTVAAGVQTTTFSNLAADTEYTFTVTAHDAFGMSKAGTFEATPKTAADGTKPEAVTGLTAAAGRSNVTLTWTASISADVKEYKVYQNDVTEAVATVPATETLTATIPSLTSGTAYTFTVKAVDYAGNESEAASVQATPSMPSASNVTAVPKYTGSILVTWDDTAAVEVGITYTYKVTGTGPTTIAEQTIESGVGQAHFTGLKVSGDDADKYTFTVQIVDSNSAECGSVSSEAVNAKTVICKIGNGYQASGTTPVRYLAWGRGSSGTSYNTAAVADSANPVASYWIMRPALSGTANYFSLEAATDTTGLGTGYFLYVDHNSRSYVAYNGTWGSGGWGNYVMVATLTGAENSETSYISDTKQASFCWSTSTWNSSYLRMNSESDSGYYVQHASLTFGVSNSSSEDSAGCAAFIIANTATADIDYSTDEPTVPTVGSATVTSGTVDSVDLSWTNPADADFSYVEITAAASPAGISRTVTSTSTSATISGLTASTGETTVTYTFTIKAYDFYGNVSDTATFSTVQMPVGNDKPTAVNATTGYTGQIIVTWADANTSSDFTYTVTAVPAAGDTVTKESIAQGTQKAVFNGLTVGTTYTVTVKAVLSETETVGENTPSVIPIQKKVHIQGGGSKYLQVKSSSSIAFFATSTDNEYAWIVMPALNGSTEMFSLKSAVSEKWLVVDLGFDHSSETAPSGGWTAGQNTTCTLILTDEPTTDDGKNQASFKETTAASGDSNYRSYLMNGDTGRYLRDWWNVANCNSAQTGNDAIYSAQKFIDAE